MIVYDNIDKVNLNERSVVAVGTFDGIHIGHREIITTAVRIARDKGIKAVCYTFSNIPYNYIKGLDLDAENAMHLISSENDKEELLEALGIDILVNIPFDDRIMNMSKDDFIPSVLVDRLSADTVCCGFNYSYGVKAEGNVDTLVNDCKQYGIAVVPHDAVMYDNQVVSSTIIREAIGNGDMQLAAKLLGRDYSLTGVVEHGRSLGKGIGYPTTNFKILRNMELPAKGVYFTETIIDGRRYNSITNIGTRPTVDGSSVIAETHIFDFDQDIYNKEVRFDMLQFLRKEKKFDSIDELKNQIKSDCEKAIQFHRNR